MTSVITAKTRHCLQSCFFGKLQTEDSSTVLTDFVHNVKAGTRGDLKMFYRL